MGQIKISSLFQLIAWCRVGEKPLFHPMMFYFPDAYIHQPLTCWRTLTDVITRPWNIHIISLFFRLQSIRFYDIIKFLTSINTTFVRHICLFLESIVCKYHVNLDISLTGRQSIVVYIRKWTEYNKTNMLSKFNIQFRYDSAIIGGHVRKTVTLVTFFRWLIVIIAIV